MRIRTVPTDPAPGRSGCDVIEPLAAPFAGPPARGQSRRNAFTLIELLVVIAIIALLVSILLPSLNLAKQIAERAVCGVQLSNLGKATAMFVSNHDGYYPMADDDSNIDDEGVYIPGPFRSLVQNGRVGSQNYSHFRLSWMFALDAYMTNATSPEEWRGPNDSVKWLEAKQCPAFKRLHERYRKPGFGASGGQLQDLNWTIGMNAYFCRGDMFNRIPNSGRRDHANRTAHIIFVEESEIRRPAETVLYGDKIAMDIAKADPDSGSDLLNISQQPYVYENAVGIRHGGHGANMGFCDGHVQYVEQETRSWQSWNGNGAAPGLKVWYPEVPQPLGVPRGSDATTYAWQDRVPQQQLIWNFQQPVNQQ